MIILGSFVASALEAGSHRGWPDTGATRLRSPAWSVAPVLRLFSPARSLAVFLASAPDRCSGTSRIFPPLPPPFSVVAGLEPRFSALGVAHKRKGRGGG